MKLSIKQLLQRGILTGSEYLDHCAHLLGVLWLTHLEAVTSTLSNELLFLCFLLQNRQSIRGPHLQRRL